VGSRTGRDDVEKRKFLTLPGLELRPLGRPVRIQSLYRLCYPGSLVDTSNRLNFQLGGMRSTGYSSKIYDNPFESYDCFMNI
jgi:hypothetical protein